MSAKGIYTALSGALAQNQRLDTIANNIANASTTGFKKDQNVFYEYVTANEKPPDVIQVPRVPASIESFYDVQGGDRGYVDSAGTYADRSQGALKASGNPLDLAIEGDGYFEVGTPQGVRFTRNGSFKLDSAGRLVTGEGYQVLKEGQGDPAQRAITMTGKNVTVSYSGDIFDGDQQVGRVSVVKFQNPDSLKKQGSSLYALKPLYNDQPTPTNDVKIHQGLLEMSNVNIVNEMTDMIQASRTFEATQNVIKSYDTIDQKLANEVAKT